MTMLYCQAHGRVLTRALPGKPQKIQKNIIFRNFRLDTKTVAM